MQKLRVVQLALLVTVTCIHVSRAENWPGWRGPRGDGSSAESNVPIRWNGSEDSDITWKAPIPGYGHSSTIVWGERIFVFTCLEEHQERVLLCLNRKDGKLLWQRTVLKAGLEKKHKLNSFASGTPVTDGDLVYVTFLAVDEDPTADPAKPPRDRTAGDMIVAAFDFDGDQKWLVRPGRFASVHGYCSSPVLFEDKLIVNGDHDGQSYIVALDRASGKTLWQVERQFKTRSYCTPIIRAIDGRTQMILSGSKTVTSYDPRDGSLHWMINGPTEQFVASLVYNDARKLLFLTAGYPEHHILAIDPTGSGNVTETHIRWRTTKGCSYVPSPVRVGDYFLVVSDGGIASCFDAVSGERFWMERLGRHYSASLVTAGGLVYFLCDDGTMTVVRPGKELDIVAENELGEYCYASPAVSDGQIFLRSENHLWCIGARRSF